MGWCVNRGPVCWGVGTVPWCINGRRLFWNFTINLQQIGRVRG